MSLGSSTVVSSPDVAVEVMPLVIQLIPCTACLFFFFLPWTQASSVSPDVSIAQSGSCLSDSSLGTLDFLFFFSLSLSLSLPPRCLTSLYFSLYPPFFSLVFHFFLFHPTLFCPSTPLAQPFFLSLNFCSAPRGTAAEQTAVPYQALSDIWRSAERQSWVNSAQQQSTNDA